MTNSYVPKTMTSVVSVLILLASCDAYISSFQGGRALSTSLYAREIVIFGPNNMRVHDNPCLLSTDGKSIIPVVYGQSNQNTQLQQAATSVKNKLEVMGASVVETLASDDFLSFLQNLSDDSDGTDKDITITYCKSAVEPAASSINHLVANVAAKYPNVKFNGLWDEIVELDDGEVVAPNLHFDEFIERYRPYALEVPKPVMMPKIFFDKSFSKLSASTVDTNAAPLECSEDEALRLLTEYLTVGDKAFSHKYASKYAKMFSNSAEHTESISRLSSLGLDSDSDSTYTNFFQGEILSAVLAPLLTVGCLSPRLLVHAKETLLNQKGGSFPEFPFVNRIRQEVVRRDWHQQLARAGQLKPLTQPIDSTQGKWDTKYQYWRGYVQREGVMSITDKTAPQSPDKKPLAFVLHGFGGSLDQFTGFASELSKGLTVISFDSLGFGYSEKPPLSYNQYLWRDQVVDFILRECEERGETEVILMGNSIGGFTVASVAAALAVLYQEGKTAVQCNGLVLMNSAGRIIEGAGLTNTPFKDLFPAYKGPPSEGLRIFGTVMFSVLQPRIEQMLVWLYPSNPGVVKTGLAGGILRDSQDPGASDVIAAGGKLPTPRPMNDLFREYTGPVLIAQGALDPLNDAKSRAKIFADIRTGITVDLMPLGHCPMDENSAMVASSVLAWAKKEGLLEKKDLQSVNPNPSPSLIAI